MLRSVMFKAKAKYSPELTKYNDGDIRHAVLARVLINDSLFVLCAISLAVCIFKIAKMSSANVYLESKLSDSHLNLCKGSGTGVLADVQEINGEAYIVFGIILFFWELLPTSLVVVFFRVQRPNQNLAPGGMINSRSFTSRAYFFDNPRRLLSSTPQPGTSSWYGSIQRNGTLTAGMAPAQQPPSSTAPLLFAYGNIQSHHHHHHNYYSTPQNNHHHHHSNYYSTPQNYYCGSQTYFCTPQN
ncbi:hypothetical protein PAMP_016354 [Pampus punctatissimus]